MGEPLRGEKATPLTEAHSRDVELAKAEEQEFELDARRAPPGYAGLLRYLDPEMREQGFEMPVIDDALTAARFLAGIVEVKRTIEDTKSRGQLIKIITGFSIAWIAAVLTILILCAASVLHLSDEVLITMLSTTTANVLGLTVIVLTGMFGRDQPDHLQPFVPAFAPSEAAAPTTSSQPA